MPTVHACMDEASQSFLGSDKLPITRLLDMVADNYTVARAAMVADQKLKLLAIKFPATWNAGAAWVLPFILRHQDQLADEVHALPVRVFGDYARLKRCCRHRALEHLPTGFVSSQDLDFSLMPSGSFQLCHALGAISWNGERVENTSAT